MIRKFIDYNKQCPMCGTDLHMYMAWKNRILFKGEKVDDYSYHFDVSLTDKQSEQFKDNHCYLSATEDGFVTEFSSGAIKEEAKRHPIYFMTLCNPKGIKHVEYSAFQISLYSACYYRSTPFYEFKRDDLPESKSWSLDITMPEHKDMINKDECWSFIDKSEDSEKVYMINLENELKQTEVWYYQATYEEMKVKGFKPKLFQKTLPLLKSRPDLSPEGLKKLVDRFDAWIIMS